MSASAAHSISVIRKHSGSQTLHPQGGSESRRNSSSSLSSRLSSGDGLSDEELENLAHQQHHRHRHHSHLHPVMMNPSIQNRASSPPPTIVLNHQSEFSSQTVDRMRRRLRFFFMNPIEKWQARRQFPWKLLLQVFKIVLVTLQVCLFGNARYSHTTFYNDNTVSLSHLFLLNWESGRDVLSYPPSFGPYALYTKNDFYRHLDHAVTQYATINENAVGTYSYTHAHGTVTGMQFCKDFFREGQIFAFNESYVFDSTILEDCITIFPLTPLNQSVWETFSSLEYFAKNNFSLNFDRLIRAELKFSLKTVLFKSSRPMETPDCFVFNVTILYDNSHRGGFLRVQLTVKEFEHQCRGEVKVADGHKERSVLLDFLNVAVILVSVLSLVLCARALFRAQLLKRDSEVFFKKHFRKKLTALEKLEFLNLWYVLITINDIMVILGSILKIQIENKKTEDDLYNICSVLLGSGVLLVWFGVLRYLGFFPKYNILILTLRRAAPDVLRFLLCALLMYAGFVFNGWLILGPYHIKFRTLSMTSECLFSLINGDDMFASFATTVESSQLIWWYSRIYLYAFISLFIYVVISLFISVIMDSYETIKMYYQQGFPKSDLMEFVSECVDDASSGAFREDGGDSWLEKMRNMQIFSSCRRGVNMCSSEPGSEYEPI